MLTGHVFHLVRPDIYLYFYSHHSHMLGVLAVVGGSWHLDRSFPSRKLTVINCCSIFDLFSCVLFSIN